jgi:hypothetical protein
VTNSEGSPGELIEERHGHRFAVVRSAIFYTPLAAISSALLAVSAFNLLTGNIGALVPAIFLGILAFATVFEAQANLRDLRASPVTTTGMVSRSWSKGRFLFIGRVHYLLVNGDVFEVNPVSAAEIAEGQTVEIEHWPHTHTVITMHRPAQTPASERPESAR